MSQCRGATDHLITPHGDSEPYQRTALDGLYASHNPSWGFGTKSDPSPGLLLATHNPSWGFGTLQRLEVADYDRDS